MSPDTTDMTRVSDLTDPEEIALAGEATKFMTSFRWCSSVKESFQAFDIANKLGVFLFHIEPNLVGVDDVFWVVVGDLPSAYLVCDNAKDWYQVLQCYIYEMQRWIDAVRSGSELRGIIPVNVSPTLEHADMLSNRLDFIQEYVIGDKQFDETK